MEDSTANTTVSSEADGVILWLLTSGGEVSASITKILLPRHDEVRGNRVPNIFYFVVDDCRV